MIKQKIKKLNSRINILLIIFAIVLAIPLWCSAIYGLLQGKQRCQTENREHLSLISIWTIPVQDYQGFLEWLKNGNRGQ